MSSADDSFSSVEAVAVADADFSSEISVTDVEALNAMSVKASGGARALKSTLPDLPRAQPRPFWKQIARNIRRNSHLILAELTIGFPFIGYKTLAALLLQSAGLPWTSWLAAFFLVLATLDFFFNLSNLVALIFVGHRYGPVCFLSWVGKHTPLKHRFNDIGEALDTMLSFSIVAVVVGVNLFPQLIALSPGGAEGSKFFFNLWNTCTVANVLGAGISRLQSSFHHAKVMGRMEKKKA